MPIKFVQSLVCLDPGSDSLNVRHNPINPNFSESKPVPPALSSGVAVNHGTTFVKLVVAEFSERCSRIAHCVSFPKRNRFAIRVAAP